MEAADKKYAMVITTCSSDDEAKKIAAKLLEMKLAACVQLFPINSYYIWNNKINNDKEITLFIKCNQACYPHIEDTIKTLHSYEVPEIIMLPIIDGFNKYLGWIDEASGLI